LTEKAFRFPENYITYVFTIAGLRILYLTWVSRGYNWKTIYYTSGILNKLIMFITMFLGAAFDVYMSIRERIPLDIIFDPQERIQENWIDNPEPAAFTIGYRIIYCFICNYFFTFLIFHYQGFSEAK
jgi:hypothetical protein